MTGLPFFLLPGISARSATSVASAQGLRRRPTWLTSRAGPCSNTTRRPRTSRRTCRSITGDRLRTTQGRVEVLFGDGSILQLDEETTVDMLSDSLRFVNWRDASRSSPAARARVACRSTRRPAPVRIDRPGRVPRQRVRRGRRAAEIEVAVIRGSADLFTESRHRVDRRRRARVGAPGRRPVAADVVQLCQLGRLQSLVAGTRARSGAEPRPLNTCRRRSVPTAQCSIPTAAGTTSRPTVTSGSRTWSAAGVPITRAGGASMRRFGWTWVGGDAWGWPTHHYGRWGTTSAGAWFWVPGSTWGPAWVHWAVSPGYVSWCALGFDGRPVVPFGYALRGRIPTTAMIPGEPGRSFRAASSGRAVR